MGVGFEVERAGRALGFVLAERAERALGFVLAERAERVFGFVEKQNRRTAILCSELQIISAILSFYRVNVSGFGFKLYGRARRARVIGFVEKASGRDKFGCCNDPLKLRLAFGLVCSS